jgi:hypothetical protein
MKLGGRGTKVMKFSEREGEILDFNTSNHHWRVNNRCMNCHKRESGDDLIASAAN